MSLGQLPRQFVVDINGIPRVGAKLFVYAPGTTDEITIHTTNAYGPTHSQPLEANGSGFFAAWYINPAVYTSYKVVVQDAAGSEIYNNDNIPVSPTSQGDIGAILYPITAAETAAGVTPTNYAYPMLDLRRYGLTTAGTTSDSINRTAVENALLVAAQLGGGILQFPPGTYAFDATVTINVNYVTLQGTPTTFWKFDPAGADVLFDFANGASSVWFCGIRHGQFISANSTTKTAVRCRDTRWFAYDDIVIADGNWPGSASIGLHMLGREELHYTNSFVLCARPVVIDINPNYATLHTDFFRFQESQIGSTETTGIAIELLSGVNYSNLKLDHVAFVLGKWGIKWTDTASTIASFGLTVEDCRFEQATDTVGYDMELTSTVQYQQQIDIRGTYFGTGRNGLKLTKPWVVTILNSLFPGGSGRTNLNITFDTTATLELIGTQIQVGSTITLTGGMLVRAAPFNAAESAISRDALYRYDEGATISQRHTYDVNGDERWSYKGVLADNATLNLPWLRASHTQCEVSAEAYSATGPVKSRGIAKWSKDGTLVKIGGDASFVVAGVGAGELRVIDGGSGLVIVNVLGQDVTLTVRTAGC